MMIHKQHEYVYVIFLFQIFTTDRNATHQGLRITRFLIDPHSVYKWQGQAFNVSIT